MRKRTLVLAGMLLLCGCTDQSGSDSGTASCASAELSSETEAAASDDTATASAAAQLRVPPKYDYVHGTDGYYNLAEELQYFKMPEQFSGTCWLYSASASMRSAYEKRTGKELEIRIPDLLEYIYGDDREEGVFLLDGVDRADYGGNQEFVTERLSRFCWDGVTLDSSMKIDPTDREAIKNAVRTRGGVTVGIDDQSVKPGVFGTYMTVNYFDAEIYDHNVTVIGWDDHFPKEYFDKKATEDGAWITYNSNLRERCYYVSYCSSLAHPISHTVSDAYSDVLSYDAGNELDTYIKTGSSTRTANVFHQKGRLGAVGTFNDFDTQDITIEIMSADFKTVLHTQEAVLDYHGYHTVELTAPVEADNFAVAITYTKGAPVEGESIDLDEGSYKTTIEKGQSFVFVDGRWKDMADSDINTVIETVKGQPLLYSEENAGNEHLSDSDIEKLSKTDFAPGNCCIKALFL